MLSIFYLMCFIIQYKEFQEALEGCRLKLEEFSRDNYLEDAWIEMSRNINVT